MKTYICTQCSHEVTADQKPKLEWDDGHRCTFIELVEVQSYEAAIPNRSTYLQIRDWLKSAGTEFYQDVVYKKGIAHRYIKAKGIYDYDTAWNLYYRITAMIGTQGVRIYHPKPFYSSEALDWEWGISITVPEHVVEVNPAKGKIGDTW